MVGINNDFFIQDWIDSILKLSGNELKLLILLSNFFGNGTYFSINILKLSYYVNFHRHTVSKILSRLIKLGYILQKSAPDGQKQYLLNLTVIQKPHPTIKVKNKEVNNNTMINQEKIKFQDDALKQTLNVIDSVIKNENLKPSGGGCDIPDNPGGGGGGRMTLEQTKQFINKVLATNGEIKTPGRHQLNSCEKLIKAVVTPNDWEFVEIIEKWLQYRKSTGLPVKNATDVAALFKFLQKISNNHPELANYIVDRSIANGWKSLIEPPKDSAIMNNFKDVVPLTNIKSILPIDDALKKWDQLYEQLKTVPLSERDSLWGEINIANNQIQKSIKFKNLFEKYGG